MNNLTKEQHMYYKGYRDCIRDLEDIACFTNKDTVNVFEVAKELKQSLMNDIEHTKDTGELYNEVEL